MIEQQRELFGTQPVESRARARRSDPVTSHEAAQAVNLPKVKGQVLECLRTFPHGATSYEVADRLGRPLVCVSPVFRRLAKDDGMVRESGRYEQADTGRRRIIWEVIS